MSYASEKSFQFWAFFGIIIGGMFWLFSGILAPFIVGFVVAYILNPIVAKLEKRSIPRWVSSLFILSLFFIIVIISLLFAVPVLVHEMVDLIKSLPDVFASVQVWFKHTFPSIELPKSFEDIQEMDATIISEKMGSVLQISKNILGNVFQGGLAVVGFLSFILLMPIVAFYLLIDWNRLNQKINELIPQGNTKTISSILNEINQSLSGFIRGQLTVCFLLGGFYAIALSVIGLKYGFFVGVASGFLSIIPYVGSIFGLVASVGLAFYQFGGWEYPLIALGIFVFGQMVEGNYLTPKLVGESVGLHPLWVMFALMAGGTLLGLMGMIVAVPVAAIIAVLIRYAIIGYKDSAYYKGKE